MSRLLAAQRALTVPGWAKEDLSRKAQAIPSLDLRFAENKSLADATTGANLVTFTRASSGTYVGSDGVLQTATTNLLLRSEEFDNASWAKQNSTATSNQTTAPDGSVAADKLIGNSTIDSHYAQQNISGATNGISYTSSVYAKASEITRIEILHSVGATLYVQGYDLSSGTLLTRVTPGTTAATGGFIQAVGNGWYRCGITQTSDGTTGAVRVTLRSANTVSFDATSQGVLLWGAQLEQSSTVGEYIPTTSTINSAPRFDHNPTTGESLGLLVEEQRTNLLLRSEEFDNASWTKTGVLAFGSGSTANAITAPNGTLTADLLTESTATNSERTCYQSGFAATPATLSCYVKPNGRNFVGLRFYGASNNWVRVTFTLTGAGTASAISAGSSSDYSATSASIALISGGWYRVSLTATRTSGVSFTVIDFATSASPTLAATSGNEFYTGDGTSGIYLWGAQLEAGSFPTSYIPTAAATATRSADVASITGTNFSSWYNSSASTLYSEAQSASGSAYTGYVYTLGADFNNAITHYRQSNLQPVARIRNAGVDEYGANGNGAIWTGTSVNKFALAISPTSGRQASNGSLNLSEDDSSISAPSVSSMTLGALVGTSFLLNGTIRRLVYWGQRLPNNVLQAITQ